MARRAPALIGAALFLGACAVERNAPSTDASRRERTRQDVPRLTVGQTGPSGGTVFFVAAEPFACGLALDALCTHLEVSPADAETVLPWTPVSAPPDEIEGTAGRAIGDGRGNTEAITAATGSLPGDSAAAWAAAYEQNGHDDWYLPSLGELNELCKYANHQSTGDTSVICDGNGNLRPGFAADDYWSSTQAGDGDALLIDVPLGGAGRIGKASRYRARPIRAF